MAKFSIRWTYIPVLSEVLQHSVIIVSHCLTDLECERAQCHGWKMVDIRKGISFRRGNKKPQPTMGKHTHTGLVQRAARHVYRHLHARTVHQCWWSVMQTNLPVCDISHYVVGFKWQETVAWHKSSCFTYRSVAGSAAQRPINIALMFCTLHMISFLVQVDSVYRNSFTVPYRFVRSSRIFKLFSSRILKCIKVTNRLLATKNNHTPTMYTPSSKERPLVCGNREIVCKHSHASQTD